ncbi:MAG TPA: S8 family serine peptidase, partial [Vicinamibacteria bacterium]|nr:S8 family serine peptidase [Vicinamibacteria bacterium]
MAKRKRVAKKAAKRRTTKKASAKTKHPRARKPVAERSPLSKLDPMLRLGASRAKIEARFQTRALEVSAVRPQAVSGLSLGIHSLASRMSPVGAERLHKEDLVSVVIDCSAGERVRESVDEWGGCGTRVSPSTVVARVPRTELESLARLSAVRYVEASTRLKLHSDLAHVSSGLVRAGVRSVPQTGAGVLVGIVDTGIDVTHPAFRSGGKTRIVNYLDQFTDQQFDSTKIDAGDAAASTDTIGHGTHVAGIAAGNGGGSPNSSLRGVAPEADLAVVKSTLETADILAAIAHIFDVAKVRNQPAVVNCSFGGHVGGHDGSSIIERTIDELSGPGRIVVVSAGNEGNDPIHAHGVVRGEGANAGRWEAKFSLSPRTFQGESGPVELGILFLQVWHQREDRLKVRLRSPSGNFLDPPTEGSKEHDFGSFFVDASRQVHPYSGDTLVTFEVITLPQSQWLSNWMLVAEEDSPGSATVGAVHAWIRDGSEGSFTTGATFEYLIGMPATAYSAVTVASYAPRNQWKSRDPQNPTIHLDDLALEALSSFSSPGPTRDGDTKPEVAAPG